MTIGGVLALLCSLTVASSAAAYAEAGRFEEPATMGGGGGRFFTGSPADGFTCAACHTGPPGLNVTVHGLPAVYQPGSTYDLALTWQGAVPEVGATLEIVDPAGHAAGELVVPGNAELSPGALCDGQFPAAQVYPLSTRGGGQRQVLGATACSATMIAARWTAPVTPGIAVEMVGGVVRGEPRLDPDAPHGPELDQVTLIRQPIASAAQPTQPAPVQTFGCTVTTRGASLGSGLTGNASTGMGSVAWAAVPLIGLALARRRHRSKLLRR